MQDVQAPASINRTPTWRPLSVAQSSRIEMLSQGPNHHGLANALRLAEWVIAVARQTTQVSAVVVMRAQFARKGSYVGTDRLCLGIFLTLGCS